MDVADRQELGHAGVARKPDFPRDDGLPPLDARAVWDNQFGSVVPERQFVRRATLDDLDAGLFRRYLREQEFGLRRVRQPDVLSEYRNFGIVADRDDEPAPTLFGMLAFGREPQRFPRMQSFQVRYAAYREAGRGGGLLLAGESNGRLDEQVNRTLRWARSLERRETPAMPRRTDRPVLPIAALREALVNALIHRDYAIGGSPVLVDVFPNRLEVTNPGSLPPGLTVAMFRRGGITRTRNEAIAHYAASAGLVERRGMGWPTIEDAMQDFNGTTPEVESDPETAWMRITLDLRPPQEHGNG